MKIPLPQPTGIDVLDHWLVVFLNILNRGLTFTNGGSESSIYNDGTNLVIDEEGIDTKFGGDLILENTTFANQDGILYKDAVPFIHNFEYGEVGSTHTPNGRNLFFGKNAGNFTMGSTATAVSHGSDNVGIGEYSSVAMTTGYQNTAIGYSTLRLNQTGLSNCALGYQSLYNNIGGTYNLGIGAYALFNINASFNVAVGTQSLFSVTNGANNVAIGHRAGRYIAGGSVANTTSDQCTFIGNLTKPLADNAQNEIVIGYNAIGKGSNTVHIGNTSVTDTYLEGDIEATGVYRAATSLYRRYYHLPLGSFDPGASGATWTDGDANTVGGWRLNASSEELHGEVDVHSDWDGATDLELEVYFEINTASAENDTVDIKAEFLYKGVGDSVTKSQIVEVATNVGDGGIKAQYTMFKAEFVINWDEVDNVVEAGDIVHVHLNLETDTSEVDDIIINNVAFHYNTTHVGIETGDT